MAQADPRTVLEDADVVAVVGCSTNPAKAAHRIPAWLQGMGYDVRPVHPSATEILGVPAMPTLADLDVAPDLVVVFRPSTEAPDVTRQAVEAGAGAVWLQLGIRSAEAEAIADQAGIAFVQDRCSGVDARTFGIDKTAG
ncbi:CoA-binding protein [Euzebya sp.]|uniref:CoA-binding protein n=1 Tax=Euzebya sp. TaxID=1971409 RepID=UPI0035157625